MRIGFFGGSFDPPHRGHVALARLALERLSLDRILFAPVGVQPLKRDRPQASFEDRVNMTRLAIDGQPAMELSLIDQPRADGRPNYTIDAIRALRGTLAHDDQIFCLLGADSFLSVGKWYRGADLLVSCDFIVASRPGFDLSRITAALPPAISVAACDAPPPGSLALTLRNAGGRESRLYLLPDLDDTASASSIRAALGRGEPLSGALPAGVEAYLRAHRLYRDGRES